MKSVITDCRQYSKFLLNSSRWLKWKPAGSFWFKFTSKLCWPDSACATCGATHANNIHLSTVTYCKLSCPPSGAFHPSFQEAPDWNVGPYWPVTHRRTQKFHRKWLAADFILPYALNHFDLALATLFCIFFGIGPHFLYFLKALMYKVIMISQPADAQLTWAENKLMLAQ